MDSSLKKKKSLKKLTVKPKKDNCIKIHVQKPPIFPSFSSASARNPTQHDIITQTHRPKYPPNSRPTSILVVLTCCFSIIILFTFKLRGIIFRIGIVNCIWVTSGASWRYIRALASFRKAKCHKCQERYTRSTRYSIPY